MRKYLLLLSILSVITFSVQAQCTTPSAPSGLLASSIDTAISVYFDSSSSANQYLAIISTAPLSATPVNGTVYSIGATLGNGKVAYYGNTYVFKINGLTAATNYYINVYSAKTGCSGEPQYSTSALNGTQTTYNSTPGIPSGYYDNASGLTCSNLKTALFNIVKPTLSNPEPTYKGILGTITLTDSRINDNGTKFILYDQYSDKPTGVEPYEFTFGTPYQDHGTLGNNEGERYNREHTFPQAWFGGSVEPMYSDLFIVFPADKKVNGLRGNLPYGKVGGTVTYTTLNGGKFGNNSTSGYTSSVFEPIDAYKGDVARENLYVATAYQDKVAGWSTNTSANAALNGTSYQAFTDWYLKLLFQWHLSDPVSPKEIQRNNYVYMIQGNRNPYIDHPEYVAMVWQCTGLLPVTLVDFTATKVDKHIFLKWYATYETNFKGYEVERSIEGSQFLKVGEIRGTNYANYSFADENIPAASLVYYRIKMIDLDGKFQYSKVVTVRLTNEANNGIVYPNPAKGKVSLRLQKPLQQDAIITVTDIIGKKVYSAKLPNGAIDAAIDISSLAPARYFITVQNSFEVIRQSFVVVK